jgi:hypothetical protein
MTKNPVEYLGGLPWLDQLSSVSPPSKKAYWIVLVQNALRDIWGFNLTLTSRRPGLPWLDQLSSVSPPSKKAYTTGSVEKSVWGFEYNLNVPTTWVTLARPAVVCFTIVQKRLFKSVSSKYVEMFQGLKLTWTARALTSPTVAVAAIGDAIVPAKWVKQTTRRKAFMFATAGNWFYRKKWFWKWFWGKKWFLEYGVVLNSWLEWLW